LLALILHLAAVEAHSRMLAELARKFNGPRGRTLLRGDEASPPTSPSAGATGSQAEAQFQG
jgi:hypothetical protein